MTRHIIDGRAEIFRAAAAGVIPCDVYAGPMRAILHIVPHMIAGVADDDCRVDTQLAAQQLQCAGIALTHRTYRLARAAQNRTGGRPRCTGYFILICGHIASHRIIVVRIIVAQPSI